MTSAICLDFGPHLKLDPGIRVRLRVPKLSDEAFSDVCRRNESWCIEREPNGELLARPKLGAITGLQIAALNAQLCRWSEETSTGVALGTMVGMRLPNGAVRCPSAAWLAAARWSALDSEQREEFLPFCADFVAEVVSPFDERGDLLDRMLEYREFGAKLGWLIDPSNRTVDIFRPREAVRTLSEITHLMERHEAPVLPGFVLDLRRIWNAGR